MFHPKEICKHDWAIVTDKILTSARQDMTGGIELSGSCAQDQLIKDLHTKTSITILKCIHCGKLDKTIVRSIE